MLGIYSRIGLVMSAGYPWIFKGILVGILMGHRYPLPRVGTDLGMDFYMVGTHVGTCGDL